MRLQVDLPDGGTPLSATLVRLERGLGRPVRWEIVVDLKREGRGGENVERLAALLSDGPLRLRCTWHAEGREELGPEATVIGATWAKSVDELVLQATSTSTEDSPEPFAPRRRVHRVQTMKELIERFSHVAVALPGVANELERVRLQSNESSVEGNQTKGQEERVCVVQDGISDWAFLSRLLRQAPLLAGDGCEWDPLVLVGSLDEDAGTSGRWVITSGGRAAFDSWNTRKTRTVSRTNDERYSRILFGFSPEGTRSARFPHPGLPEVIRWAPDRAYSHGAWLDWIHRDSPLFVQGSSGLVWKVEDRLSLRENPASLRWSSKLHCIPTGCTHFCDQDLPTVTPWAGLAVVTESSKVGPFIKGRLAGFEADACDVEIRVSAPYAGTDGKGGLHLVPEVGRTVLVSWTGFARDSLVLVSDGRWEPALFPSPSLRLEDTLTSELKDVELKAIGTTRVGSDLAMEVAKSTSLESTGPVRVQGDSAETRWSGGIFRTGKPF